MLCRETWTLWNSSGQLLSNVNKGDLLILYKTLIFKLMLKLLLRTLNSGYSVQNGFSSIFLLYTALKIYYNFKLEHLMLSIW